MIFLRHPRPAVAPGLCYGRLDLAEGRGASAEIDRAIVQTPPCSAVVASPALRCRGLALALADRDGVSVTWDDRLLELDFGAWEGVPWDRIDRAQSDPWAADPEHVSPPGGETFADLRRRVTAALDGLAGDTAVVCHAGPIRAARMILTGADFAKVFAWPVPYAEPVILERECAPWPI